MTFPSMKSPAAGTTLLAAGYKGAAVVRGLLQAGRRLRRIVSYKQTGDRSGAFDMLAGLASSHGVPFEDSARPSLDSDTLILIVGWQFLLRGDLSRCVVFHDSLLPALRGFSPTVTAMLLGHREVGVTAFRPVGGVDAGPICGQRSVSIPAGANVQAVFDLQSAATTALALEVIDRAAAGTLHFAPQDATTATYSLWRDALDYFLDWRQPAERVLDHIRAVGFPHEGAKAVLDGMVLTIHDARSGPDLTFAIRDPGKVWTIEAGRPLVVCGSGTVWIEGACTASGAAFEFRKTRARFLTADTAWIAKYAPTPSWCRG
jgi:methionyl-tRNA formyltransferase